MQDVRAILRRPHVPLQPRLFQQSDPAALDSLLPALSTLPFLGTPTIAVSLADRPVPQCTCTPSPRAVLSRILKLQHIDGPKQIDSHPVQTHPHRKLGPQTAQAKSVYQLLLPIA